MQIFTNSLIPEQTRTAVNRFNELNRMPQSIMLTGGNDALQLKCAYELSASVLCSEKNAPCGKCSACKKALSKLHPDITLIQPTDGRKLVSIDDIRTGVIEKLYITPNEADNKVFILTGASDYSVYIQNALLKTIEEPPEDCMFIILCNQRSDMLTTIISRATELFLGETPDGKPKAKDVKADEIAKKLMHSFANGNEFAMIEASADIGKEREVFTKTLEKSVLIIRDALADGSGVTAMGGNEEISSLLSVNYSIEGLMKLKSLIDEISYSNSVNCNIGLTASLMTSEAGKLIKEYYRK